MIGWRCGKKRKQPVAIASAPTSLRGDIRPAIVVLADGTTYCGRAFGAEGTAIGEMVFNTGMTGYQEVMTDPSYMGQIVTFTCPELGNTGVNELDTESERPQIRGAIARNISRLPSSWRSQKTLPAYLQEHQIVGVAGIDTRALTRKLRSEGATNGGISTDILDPAELLAKVQAAPSMQGANLAAVASTNAAYEWSEPTAAAWKYGGDFPAGDALTVVAIDFGVKRNILRRLTTYGCRVIVVPATATSEEILSHQPDGIFLSNGPGDPAAVTQGIATVKTLLEERKPVFGICLGHQIINLALGGDTFKLKFGHRGLNQPCGLQGRVEITSQNHGFAVSVDSLPESAELDITHLNLNDRTLAGIKHKSLPIFSVQYHPEASPGPHDADYLFVQFVEMMRAHAAA
ncbi:MAG: glutamine-hydrolyzing carbamoyl-phosphate synthase small subunit [Cyanobacteria bacterium J06642_2]